MRFTHRLLLVLLLFAICALASCGSGSSASTTPIPTPTPTPTPPPPPPPTNSSKASHVVLMVLENKNFGEVVGSPDAPFLNSLIPQGTLATDYHANKHPSIGDYFMLTSGNLVTNDDAFAGTVSPPEIASVLTTAGMDWKVYAEGIPSVGYTGPNVGFYLKRHNPLSFFTDVAGTPAANNIIPFTHFAADIGGTLPAFTMVVGNIFDTGHDCRTTPCTESEEVQQQDAFLKAVVPLIQANASFQSGGMLVITFDESDNDNSDANGGMTGGGKVVTLLLGTNVKVGAQAVGNYQHQSLLRLMLEGLGLTTFPSLSATAPSMSAEVFN
jgi:hypothetical protein